MNRFYQLLLYFHILVVLLQNVWLNIVFYDAVADYGRKYMEYGIENGTVVRHGRGKESFYIIALHFVGFKLCTLMLSVFDIKL